MKMTTIIHKKARIEIIPLIDVIFFCLATFVLVTLSMNKNTAHNIKLPQAVQTRIDTAATEPVLLTITEGGDVYWNADIMAFPQLKLRMEEYKSNELDPRIVINGEPRALFGFAAQALEIARSSGIEKVTFTTSPRPIPRR